ncbi:MAG TPA: LCP family protein [Acidimicrobiia bacterium]|nr:LCP family protein [Acidimicrobiia bacterium]
MSLHSTFRRTGVVGLALSVALVAGACSGGSRTEKGLVIGESTSTSTALPAPDIIEDPTTTTAEASTTTGAKREGGGGGRGSGAAVSPKLTGIPDGSPYGEAIPFTSSVEVPTNLVWVLAIGSDARPGGDMRKSNGDSIHLIGVDPQTGAGTVLGFPRDSWVKIPGRGTGKINSALAMGGPKLMAETVRQLTGLPVDFYVLTAFEGFQRIVDEVGGVNVQVDKSMNDRYSGARFDAGWHNMNGGQALAYSRNRHDVPNGDFTRSLHQGNVMMSGLAKLRAEVGDDEGLHRWIGVLLRHADLDSPPQSLLPLAALARRLDPAKITNIVAPGRVGTAGSASVVYLTDEARKLFIDLRPDAAIGGPSGDEARPAATTTTTTVPPTTTTTVPAVQGTEESTTTSSTAPSVLGLDR